MKNCHHAIIEQYNPEKSIKTIVCCLIFRKQHSIQQKDFLIKPARGLPPVLHFKKACERSKQMFNMYLSFH